MTLVDRPYELGTGLESHSISFENPTGGRGAGGMAARPETGVGRKGRPSVVIASGETVALADIEGPGTIRHIWMATRPTPEKLRGITIRGFWEDQKHPSIECPLGDLMGFSHGKHTRFNSAVHSVSDKAGLNLYLPMPFATRARFELTNESGVDSRFYYQMDYTIGDMHPAEFGRLHVLFHRENPTTLKQDFEILPQRNGRGRYIGTVVGVRVLDSKYWWGEGEAKIYLDGDRDFPTICTTGTEDYVCLGFEMQETCHPYGGCTLNRESFVSIYRWHLPDPVFFNTDIRVTLQQLGIKEDGKLFERQDDVSCSTFWYEDVPGNPLPPYLALEFRMADIWPN